MSVPNGRPVADEKVHLSPSSRLKKQVQAAKQDILTNDESEIPRTKVLLPYERLPIPAKKPKDQPLVSYHIDSDEEQESQSLLTSATKTKSDRPLRKQPPPEDPFEIDFDADNSDSDKDLDLIPLTARHERKPAANCCNVVQQCVLQ